MTCIRCKSCGVTPGKTWDLAWNHEQDLCPDCTLLHNKGRHAPSSKLFFFCFLFFKFIVKVFKRKQPKWAVQLMCPLRSGNFCTICHKCYDDNKQHKQMIQCSACSHWIHYPCEGFSGERLSVNRRHNNESGKHLFVVHNLNKSQ